VKVSSLSTLEVSWCVIADHLLSVEACWKTLLRGVRTLFSLYWG
jgi:hypothetical protein